MLKDYVPEEYKAYDILKWQTKYPGAFTDKFCEYESLKEFFETARNRYREMLPKNNTAEYKLNEYQSVFQCKGFTVFVGIINYCPDRDEPCFILLIDELADNTVFRFIKAKFERELGTDASAYFRFNKFNGYIEDVKPFGRACEGIPSSFSMVDNIIPSLGIKENYESREGDSFYLTIFRFRDGERTYYSAIYAEKGNDYPNIKKQFAVTLDIIQNESAFKYYRDALKKAQNGDEPFYVIAGKAYEKALLEYLLKCKENNIPLREENTEYAVTEFKMQIDEIPAAYKNEIEKLYSNHFAGLIWKALTEKITPVSISNSKIIPAEKLFPVLKELDYYYQKPVDESFAADFEKINRVQIPELFRAFVVNVGNAVNFTAGRTDFEYVINGLPMTQRGKPRKSSTLSKPFPFDRGWNLQLSDDKFELHNTFEDCLLRLYPEDDICCNKCDYGEICVDSMSEYTDEYSLTEHNGSLMLADMGCGMEYRLVMNGPHFGEVWFFSECAIKKAANDFGVFLDSFLHEYIISAD